MTVIRIEGSHTNLARRKVTTKLGSFVGSAFGPVGKDVGAAIGSIFGNLIDGKATKPVEIDTETNKLTVLDKRGNPIDSETARLLQQVWDTGSVPLQLRQKYWQTAQEIVRQRFEFRTPGGAYYATETPEPIVIEGSQYSGANSMIGIVPPGGFAGFAGMTPASKMAMKVKNFGGTIGVKRRRKKRKAGGKAGRKRKRASGTKRGRKRLVKGSAAAKRYMASIRRKRK